MSIIKKNMKRILLIVLLNFMIKLINAQSIESISFSALASSNDNFQPLAGGSFSGYVSNASGSLTIASEYGKNDYKIANGVSNISQPKDNIKIYPNPTDNYIVIDEFSKNKNELNTVLVTDINGRKLLLIENYIDKTPIDFKPFNVGVYFITLTINNETITSRKIIKSK